MYVCSVWQGLDDNILKAKTVIEIVWSVDSTVLSQLVTFAKFVPHMKLFNVLIILWQCVAIALVLTNVNHYCWPYGSDFLYTLYGKSGRADPPYSVFQLSDMHGLLLWMTVYSDIDTHVSTLFYWRGRDGTGGKPHLSSLLNCISLVLCKMLVFISLQVNM